MMGMHDPRLEPEVTPLLEHYAWPGNVRELRNVMERALILSGGTPVALPQLPREVLAAQQRRDVAADPDELAVLPMAEIEKRHLRRALEHCRGNKTRAAKLLGITRLTLRTKVVAYGWAEFLEQAEGDER
jgi:DNA-binding NtrC family response regulator